MGRDLRGNNKITNTVKIGGDSRPATNKRRKFQRFYNIKLQHRLESMPITQQEEMITYNKECKTPTNYAMKVNCLFDV